MSTTQAYFKIVETVPNPDNTLVIVGTALDGPSFTPFTISPLKPITDLIGISPLAEAYSAARRAGLSDIILYRINGTHSTGAVMYGGQDIILFRSVSANMAYNDISIDFGPDKVTVTGTTGIPRYYFFSAYPSAGKLVDILNLDALFGLIEFTAQAIDPSFDMSRFDVDHLYTVILDDGATDENLIPNRTTDISSVATTLEGNLRQALFGYDSTDQDNYEPNSTLGLMDYGVIVLADMFHDDPADFTNLLSRFCQNKGLLNGGGTIGVIGVSPLFTVTDDILADKVTSLLSKAPNHNTGTVVEVDLTVPSPLSYIQIVTGDTTISNLYNEVTKPISLAYDYAAMQALLSYHKSMTNKSLVSITSLNYEFEKKDLEDLLSNGYISIVSSTRKGYVTYYAVTGIGKNTKLLSSPEVVRITQVLTRKVSDYLDSYIGSTSVAFNRQNMQKDVNKVIQEFVDSKIIRSFSTQFTYNSPNGEANVNIVFTPFSSVSTVSSTVTLPFGRGAFV